MRPNVVAGITALIAVSIAAPGILKAQGGPRGGDYFPNLPVVTQDGKTLKFYDDVIKGKIVVINFIYTHCPDLCPLATARLGQVQEKLGDIVGHDLFLVSLTVDPERDTPERLKEFSASFSAGPGWLFLTGAPVDIRSINAKLGNKSTMLSEHRNEIVLGNEATGEWQRNTVFGDLDRLIMDIHAMDPKWRNQVRAPTYDEASNTGYALGLAPGQTLFKKLCAPCHTIGVGDRVGPDLRGVTERRERAWLENFIRHPDTMRAERDPEALALVAKFPGARMPALGLAEVDASDLMAYLRAETDRLNQAQDAPDPATTPHHHHHE
jgi:protein SCO1